MIRTASKTISVTEDVYDLLDREKLPGESFSVTITRLVRRRGKISDSAGAWADMTDVEFTSLEDAMAEVRGSANIRMRSK